MDRQIERKRSVMRKTGKAAIIFLMLMFSSTAFANNLVVSNAALVNRSAANHTYDISFDISQDNSWFIAGAPSATANWDAAWIFAKYSVWTGSTWSAWSHCKLLNTGYTAPAGSQMDFGSTGSSYLGTFMRRSSAGTGTVNWTGAAVRWDYGADGIDDTASIRIKLFGIEMVYIPQGSFYAGSGGTEVSPFYLYPTTTNPVQITSEDAITVGTTNGNLYYASSTCGGDRAGPIPAAFPKGYNAFYLMKYEMTQGQYADFLSMLTSTQAAARYYVGSTYRYTISGSYPDYSASRPDRVCDWLSWADLAAYGDWAALRPFTELEFEKACRGPNSPVANEYAWGSTSITAPQTISGAEDGTETITTPNANCCYNNTTFTDFINGDGGAGPLRAGIFAKSGTTRAEAGAGYYGNMELSGSFWERAVTVGNETGRGFTGTHGDGSLNPSGDATNSDWPGTEGTGVGLRGGVWSNVYPDERVSDRNHATNTVAAAYRAGPYSGTGRLARTSP